MQDVLFDCVTVICSNPADFWDAATELEKRVRNASHCDGRYQQTLKVLADIAADGLPYSCSRMDAELVILAGALISSRKNLPIFTGVLKDWDWGKPHHRMIIGDESRSRYPKRSLLAKRCLNDNGDAIRWKCLAERALKIVGVPAAAPAAAPAVVAGKHISKDELERNGRRLLKTEPALTIRNFHKRLATTKARAEKLDCWIERPHKNHGGRKPRAAWEKPAYQDGKRDMALVDATIDNENALRELVAEQADDGRHEAVKPNKVLIVRRTKAP